MIRAKPRTLKGLRDRYVRYRIENARGQSRPLPSRFQQTGQFVEIDGNLDASVMLKCGRCLKEFRQLLAESFTITFVPQQDGKETEEDVELETEELGLVSYQDDVLELLDPLQEQLLMTVPISPVCSTSCCGLCPECGVDLNLVKCDCIRKPFNDKFNILADMNFKKS